MNDASPPVLAAFWAPNRQQPVSFDLVHACLDGLSRAIRRIRERDVDVDGSLEPLVFGHELATIIVEDRHGEPFTARLKAPPGRWRRTPDMASRPGVLSILKRMHGILSDHAHPGPSGVWPDAIDVSPREVPLVGAAWEAIEATRSRMAGYWHPTPWSHADVILHRGSTTDPEPDLPVEGPARLALAMLHPAVTVIPDRFAVEIRPHHAHVNPIGADPLQRMRDVAAWRAWRDAAGRPS